LQKIKAMGLVIMPLSSEDIKSMISSWESPVLEFKLKTDKNLGKTICAFSNSNGGTIVLGVDSNKQIKGFDDPDTESRHIREIIDQCKPRPRLTQTFVKVETKTLIVLEVSPIPPYESACFYGGKCYIREGTTNQELSGEDLVLFLKNKLVLNFEIQRSPANIDDLDYKKLGAYFQKRHIPAENFDAGFIKTILSGMHIANYDGEFYLKNAAVMFFAKEPVKFMPNLKVRIVKYSGSEASIEAIESDKTIYGTIPELIDSAFEIVKKSTGKQYTLTGTKREEIDMYPQNALREAITNALGHRDYFNMQGVLIEIFYDRLQITNPGGLLYGQTIKNFDKTPQHRNPICYEILHDLGYGEGLGLGIRLIRTACRQHGLPDPEFYSLGDTFRTILYNSRSKMKAHYSINERQKQALAYLDEKNKITSKDYSRMYNVSIPTAVNDLNELIKLGKVKRIGRFRNAYYVKV